MTAGMRAQPTTATWFFLWRTWLLLSMAALLSMPIAAEVYKWVDENGNTHFGDQKPENLPAESLDLKITSYSFPKVEANTLPPAANSSHLVVMYSTAWCGFCKKARKFFRAKGIAFKEYDVENSAKGRQDYKRLNGRGVPIILVGKKRMNGFSEKRFLELYRSS